MSTKKILLAPHHDVTAFCSQDETRYVLTGVHYNAEKKRLEATDGRMLAIVPVIEADDGEYPRPITDRKDPPVSRTIPADSLREALANIPKRTTLPILKKAQLDTETDATSTPHVMLSTTDLDREFVVRSKVIEGNFPGVEHTLPQTPPNWKIALNADLLSKIARYAASHCNDKYRAIHIEGWDETLPVRIKLAVGDELQEAVILLMPMRTI